MTKVVNIRLYGGTYSYIGRPSICGNPFVIGKDGNRDNVIRLFTEYFNKRIVEDNDFRDYVGTLRGGVIGCFCRPKDGFKGKVLCHGQIIAAYLDGVFPAEVE